ncbi:anthranilate phosphoribosyltransferase [Bacillus pakistanensis]|uniref:Anthranilate phosphoribosyltransferase n=1 Tax=Rossellomorea pakistanensis TaxID=992288 RepID=A0ABS2N8H9_9BACI|nr:anthranilate phosphoribosyltransferase [Bacillus pakistanensis]MBM7584167.1 anthranilate phosphoribosyltransferase [Bacillus pakistanensis]
MKTILKKLSNGDQLNREEMVGAARSLFYEETTDSEIAALLMALKIRGESVEEITGIVEVLREKAMPIQSKMAGIMDNCGTGGDGSQSFNISTTSAFVLAGAGAKVAKHGNRSISSKTGSADVLEHLGISLDFHSDEVEELLDENGIAFLFAPHVHYQLKRIMKVRKELGVPTIFNLIGPLTNPIALENQFVGVYRRDMLMKMSSVLHQLGRKRSVVINGAGFMDEASLSGENHLVLLDKGETIPFTLYGEEVGLPQYHNSDILGGDAKHNAEILMNVLRGKKGAYLDTVLLNAGLGLFASGIAATPKEGVEKAKESIDSGAALQKLHYLIEYSQKREKQVI